MEEWRPISDTNNIYQVSNTGRVRNRRTGRILRTNINSRGYKAVQLHVNNQPVTKSVHKLVAEAFNGGSYPGMDVHHRDGNKLNNYSDNLEWATRKENIQRAFDMGLNQSHRKKPVRILDTGEEFESATACARYLGVDPASVRNCIYGKSQSCKGYKIEYV